MAVTLSCGCQDKAGIDAIYAGEDCIALEGFVPCLFYAHMCADCIKRWKQDGVQFFDTAEEADQWLESAPNHTPSQ